MRRNIYGSMQDLRCAKWNTPASATNICSLLGIVGYYQRFIKGFSKITKPMTEFLGKE
jgi:hypothetical protein